MEMGQQVTALQTTIARLCEAMQGLSPQGRVASASEAPPAASSSSASAPPVGQEAAQDGAGHREDLRQDCLEEPSRGSRVEGSSRAPQPVDESSRESPLAAEPQAPNPEASQLAQLLAMVTDLREQVLCGHRHGMASAIPPSHFEVDGRVVVPRLGSHLKSPYFNSCAEFEKAVDDSIDPDLSGEEQVFGIERNLMTVTEARQTLREGLCELLTKKPNHRLQLPFPGQHHSYNWGFVDESVASPSLRAHYHLHAVGASWRVLAWDILRLSLAEGCFWLSCIDLVVEHYHLDQLKRMRSGEGVWWEDAASRLPVHLDWTPARTPGAGPPRGKNPARGGRGGKGATFFRGPKDASSLGPSSASKGAGGGAPKAETRH